MKALLGLFKRTSRRRTGIGLLVFLGILLIGPGLANCAIQGEAGRFLAAVASGIALSIVLRIALNFDPEE